MFDKIEEELGTGLVFGVFIAGEEHRAGKQGVDDIDITYIAQYTQLGHLLGGQEDAIFCREHSRADLEVTFQYDIGCKVGQLAECIKILPERVSPA